MLLAPSGPAQARLSGGRPLPPAVHCARPASHEPCPDRFDRAPNQPESPPSMSHASLTALMTGLVDYAGLFPPAQLSMADAAANYLQYRASGDAWMLGRFVCPAPRLGE